MEPLLHGDYPISMKQNAGAKIPAFTGCESKQVKGSYDFIGIIHYARFNVSDNAGALNMKLRDLSADMAAQLIRMCFIMFKHTEFYRFKLYKHAVLITTIFN